MARSRPPHRPPSLGRALGGGLLSVVALDLFSGGTFTRSSEASYQTAPPNDGTAAFMAWASSNVRRNAAKYDGVGVDRLLMEASRTNVILHSEDLSNAAWVKTGGTVGLTNLMAPDGDSDADVYQFGADAAHQVHQTFAATDNHRTTGVVWARMTSGTGSILVGFLRKDGTESLSTFNLTTTWQRCAVSISILAGATTPRFIVRNGDATARDVVLTWFDVRTGTAAAGTFADSYIRSAGAPVTRSADVLTYSTLQFPPSFYTSGFKTVVKPLFIPTDMHNAGSGVGLFGFGAGADGVLLSYNATIDPARLFVDSVSKMSNVFNWVHGSELEFSFRPSAAAGQIGVDGASSGNGLSNVGTFAPAGTLTVGSRVGGTTGFYGFLDQYLVGL